MTNIKQNKHKPKTTQKPKICISYINFKHRTFKARSIIREEEEHFIMTKALILQKDEMMLSAHAPVCHHSLHPREAKLDQIRSRNE